MQQIKTKFLSLGFLFFLYSITLYAAEVKTIIPISVNPIAVFSENYNNTNPNWSNNSKTISYERFNNLTHDIALFHSDKKSITHITSNKKKKDEFEIFFANENTTRNFSFDLSWSSDNVRYVFVSNGSTDNFDLYLGDTNSDIVTRITFHDGVDNQPRWNPVTKQLAFVSGRLVRATLHLYDIDKKNITPLIATAQDALNPAWSPDGKKLAFMLGDINAFQIYVIDDIQQPQKTLRKITDLPRHNNIRPSWSPDGKKLAFFTLDLNDRKNQHWKISVINSNSQTMLQKKQLHNSIISTQVIQNSLRGPSWLPDSKHIVYIKYLNEHSNPIFIVNIDDKQQTRIITHTKINRNVIFASNGTLAFQNQDQQWSRIFMAKLPALIPSNL